MNGFAVGMVLASAVLHATWNVAAKQVPGGGARFVFLYYTVSAVLCLPFGVAALLLAGDGMRWSWLGAALVTAALHVGYGLALQRGYSVGDLSVVYPLARGTGPLLSVTAAIVLLGERPGAARIAGAALVVTGVLVISLGGGALGGATGAFRAGIGYGLLTGAVIAGYTVWDAHAVRGLDVPPVLYFTLAALLQSMLLAPQAIRGREDVGSLWRTHRKQILLVGALSPAAYLLVLYAMRMAPVSMIAPVRELSIVLGGLAAWRLFGEANPARRIFGSVIVLAGVGVIAAA